MNKNNLFYFDIHGHKKNILPLFFKIIAKNKFPEDIGFDDLKKTDVSGFIVNAVGDFSRIMKFPISPYKNTINQINKIKKQIINNNLKIVFNLKQFIENINEKNKFLILGIEGADFLEGDMKRLDDVYNLGVRVITLIHFNKNCIGIPCMGFGGKKIEIKNQEDGLTNFGYDIVKSMNKKGILIDIAHANEKTALDVLRCSEKPVICSHTGSKDVMNFERYISDEVAKNIASNGGLIGLWLYYYKGKGIKTEQEFQLHLKHFKNIVGARHLAIGTDINAVPGNMEGYNNLYDIDIILKNLERAGFNDDEIELIAGKNFQRVFTTILA